MYLKAQKYDQAISQFIQQSAQNELAENQYYLGLSYQKKGDNALFLERITKAKELYLSNRKMVFHYTEPIDRVYLEEINHALFLQKEK